LVETVSKAAGWSEAYTREVLDMDPKKYEELFGASRKLLKDLTGK